MDEGLVNKSGQSRLLQLVEGMIDFHQRDLSHGRNGNIARMAKAVSDACDQLDYYAGC